jgi:hypothetical protein
MFTINQIEMQDRSETRGKIQEVISGLGWLGEGSKATVYDGGYYALKFTIEDTGYFNYLREIQKADTNNPYIPRILEVTIYTIFGRPIYSLIKSEKLRRIGIRDSQWDELESLRLIISNNRPASILRTRVDRKHLKELKEIVHRAKNNDPSLRFDLHNNNWMLRDDGHIVLIDPLI